MTYTISPTSTLSTTPAMEPANDESRAILTEICSFFNVRAEAVCGSSRRYEVKNARWLFWYIMSKRGHTLKQCGALTGGHDHTSVVNCLQKMKYEIETDKIVGFAYHKFKHYFTDGYQQF